MGRASWVNAANQIELARKEATPQGKLDLRCPGSRKSAANTG